MRVDFVRIASSFIVESITSNNLYIRVYNSLFFIDINTLLKRDYL